jgi:ribonuclease T
LAISRDKDLKKSNEFTEQNGANFLEKDKPNKPMAARFRGYLPVIVDVETGGFNSATDAILELGAVIPSMTEAGELIVGQTFFQRIIPFEGSNLEDSALKFTGIDPNHPLRIAQPERDVFTNFFDIVRKTMKANDCNRAILTGHNAHFDQSFVNAAAERHKFKRNPFHPFSNFDTATLSGLAFGQTVLARACEAAGIKFSNEEAHSARYDANKTAELFFCIVNRWKNLGGWPLGGD